MAGVVSQSACGDTHDLHSHFDWWDYRTIPNDCARHADYCFVVCTAHKIQVDVPLDNVLALVEAYQTCA